MFESGNLVLLSLIRGILHNQICRIVEISGGVFRLTLRVESSAEILFYRRV